MKGNIYEMKKLIFLFTILVIICFCIVLFLRAIDIQYYIGDTYITKKYSHIENLSKEQIINLSKAQIVSFIFCDVDNINTNPTSVGEYNNLKKQYFTAYNLNFTNCRR